MQEQATTNYHLVIETMQRSTSVGILAVGVEHFAGKAPTLRMFDSARFSKVLEKTNG